MVALSLSLASFLANSLSLSLSLALSFVLCCMIFFTIIINSFFFFRFIDHCQRAATGGVSVVLVHVHRVPETYDVISHFLARNSDKSKAEIKVGEGEKDDEHGVQPKVRTKFKDDFQDIYKEKK